jgi:uncharacterized protein (DUF2141 family)
VYKKLLYIFILLSTQIDADNLYRLKVEVNNLRNSDGVVIFSLYNRDKTVPDERLKNFYKQKVVKIVNNYATTTFNDLHSANYSVGIIHDENENHKIDKGFILPLEGVGYSNINSISPLNKPNFKNSSFYLNENREESIKVIYF